MNVERRHWRLEQTKYVHEIVDGTMVQAIAHTLDRGEGVVEPSDAPIRLFN